jgi:hypothetical protein
MDIAGLQDAAKIGFIRCARTQPLDRRFLVAEGFKEGIREFRRFERLLSEIRYCLFYFDRVQLSVPSGVSQSTGKIARLCWNSTLVYPLPFCLSRAAASDAFWAVIVA